MWNILFLWPPIGPLTQVLRFPYTRHGPPGRAFPNAAAITDHSFGVDEQAMLICAQAVGAALVWLREHRFCQPVASPGGRAFWSQRLRFMRAGSSDEPSHPDARWRFS